MTDQIRSIRLRPISSSVLDKSTNSLGELFFDRTTGTLRLFDGTYADGVSLATHRWVNSAIAAIPVTDLTGLATETYVDTAVSNLVNAAPAALDTLNELAAALGDDANFATTVTNSIALKAPIDSPTFTGAITAGALGFATGATINEFSTDDTLADSSITAVPTESAVKTYVDTAVAAKAPIDSPTFTGTTTLQQTIEVLTTKTAATGTVAHDFTTGSIFYHSSISSNFTANFTNVPTTNDRSISLALILVQGATAFLPAAVQIDGSAQSIKWFGGGTPIPNPNNIDVVSFTLLRTGSAWTVMGTLGTYA